MKKTNCINCLTLVLATALAACGGSGGSAQDTPTGPTPTPQPITSIGQISGFGSIYVNGVEYETDGASYDVDDGTGSDDSSLSIGMVVRVRGSVNPDGRSGTANSVYYDDELEGPVANLATDPDDASIKTFTIWGAAVQVSETGTHFDNEDDPAFSFDTLQDGDIVEASGQWADDVLFATYIEKQDAGDDEFEAKGTIDQFNGTDQFVLILKNESSLAVTLAPGAEIPNQGIMDGMFVEVEGTIPDPVNAPDAILAAKVEDEDEDYLDDGNDDDDVEIRGILSYDAVSDTWSVRDVTLIFDASTEYDPAGLRDAIADGSANGLSVKVEGDEVADGLRVDEIEIEMDEDDLSFKADADTINATGPKDGVITLSFGNATGTVEVVVTPSTIFMDDDAISQFDLRNVPSGQKLEIDAGFGDDGRIYATSLQLENSNDYEIEGPVTGIDATTITVLTVTFGHDANTFFEDGMPVVDDFAEVEDENGDGIADEVEIED